MRFSEKIYAVVGVAMVAAFPLLFWAFIDDVKSGLDDFPGGDSLLTIFAIVVVFLITVGLGSFYITSWRHGSVGVEFTKRKVFAVLLLIIFLPGSVGLFVYDVGSIVPTDRGPYLSWTRDPRHSITVTWESLEPGYTHFKYWTSPEEMSNVIEAVQTGPRSDDGYYHYTVTLVGLSPDTEYWYTVDGFCDKAYNFRTAPSDASEPFSFIVYGDSRESSKLGDNQHIPLVRSMLDRVGGNALNYSLVINVGDIAYEYDDVKGWNLHFYAVKELASHLPYMVSWGNHEWNTAADYLWDSEQPSTWIHEYPVSDIDNESIGGIDEVSYAFGYGAVYFISIGYQHAGTNLTEHRQLAEWINKHLAIGNSSYMFTVVYFHRPPFDNRPGDSGDDNPDIIRNLCPLLHLGDADVVIAGHHHVLGRYNVTWSGDDDNSTLSYIITGGGGASIKSMEEGSYDDKYGLGFKAVLASDASKSKVYHYYVVDVDPGAGTMTFVAYDMKGNVVDQFVQYAVEK